MSRAGRSGARARASHDRLGCWLGVLFCFVFLRFRSLFLVAGLGVGILLPC